jgi:hypothetical protein
MNTKQKRILVSALILISSTIIYWLISGAEIYTKTQVLIEKKDELFGWTEKQWVNKFVFGLDYAIGIVIMIVLISSVLILFFRNKNKRN